MEWFTSDWHLDHKNIIKYSNRPFDDVYKMNDAIIQNCNDCVHEDDNLFFLGDFAFTKDINSIVYFRKRIKCKNFYFILGNHDKEIIRYQHTILKNVFNIVGHYQEYNFNGTPTVLCHYAFRTWNKAHHGSYHLYGHSHGTLQEDPQSRSFDVGVDCWDFKPVSWNQVVNKMSAKNFVPIDKHN